MNFESELEIFLQVYKTDKFDDWASGRIEDWEAAAKQGDVSAAKMVAMDVHQCLYGLYGGNVEDFGVAANMPADMIPAFKLASSNGCTEASEMLALYEKHVGKIPGGYTPATPAPAASPQPAATTPDPFGGWTPSSQPAQENDEAPALDPSLVEFAEAAAAAKKSPKQDSGEQVHFRGAFHVIKPDIEDGEPMMGYDYNSIYILCTTQDIEFTYTPSIPENTPPDFDSSRGRYIDPNFVAVLRPLMQEYKSHFEGLDPNTVLCVDATKELYINNEFQEEDCQYARWVTHDLMKGLWINHQYPWGGYGSMEL